MVSMARIIVFTSGVKVTPSKLLVKGRSPEKPNHTWANISCNQKPTRMMNTGLPLINASRMFFHLMVSSSPSMQQAKVRQHDQDHRVEDDE